MVCLQLMHMKFTSFHVWVLSLCPNAKTELHRKVPTCSITFIYQNSKPRWCCGSLWIVSIWLVCALHYQRSLVVMNTSAIAFAFNLTTQEGRLWKMSKRSTFLALQQRGNNESWFLLFEILLGWQFAAAWAAITFTASQRLSCHLRKRYYAHSNLYMRRRKQWRGSVATRVTCDRK